tara:strand:+ start:291 stop:485 length:195 start_codon:yes stop_codon:yes gene_type:complete
MKHNRKEVFDKAQEYIKKLNENTLRNPPGSHLIVSQKWVDEVCEKWECTEEELKHILSGVKPPK